MPPPAAPTAADAERLAARVVELERERKHLLAVIEILKEVSTSLHFLDVRQAIARKRGEAFGLDRCSSFLAERGGASVRLVASYEDPTIRNYVVDLERYPELKRAMQTGETVFIPDATTDPSLKHVKGELLNRPVKSITLVPIPWRGGAIGPIFPPTIRDGPTFSVQAGRFGAGVVARGGAVPPRGLPSCGGSSSAPITRITCSTIRRSRTPSTTACSASCKSSRPSTPSSARPTVPLTASAPRRRRSSASIATWCRCCRSPTPSTRRSSPSGRIATPGSSPRSAPPATRSK